MIVNVQARELGLGSGGFDVLYVNLTRGLDLAAAPGRPRDDASLYAASGRCAPRGGGRRAGREPRRHARRLLLAALAACSGLRGNRQGRACRRTSSWVAGHCPSRCPTRFARLKKQGLVEIGIASGACFDGDAQAVGVASALAWAAAEGFAVAVCAVGPGIVGTGSRARPWRSGRGRGRERRKRARRLGRAGRAGVRRRLSRAPPRRLAPHAGRARLWRSAKSRWRGRPASKPRTGSIGARAGGRQRVARGVRGASARAHGPGTRRGSVVLRFRIRRREACPATGWADGAAAIRTGRRAWNLEHVRR